MMPSEYSSHDSSYELMKQLEFKIGGVNISTSVAEKPWLINFFFNQEKIHRPSVVGLTTHGYTPRHIAYLQLCIGNRCLMIGMCHLCHLDGGIPSSLKEFCADEQICFVEVNMKDTLAALEKNFGLKFGTNNWKDLGEWAATALNGSTTSSSSTSVCEDEKPKDDQLMLMLLL